MTTMTLYVNSKLAEVERAIAELRVLMIMQAQEESDCTQVYVVELLQLQESLLIDAYTEADIKGDINTKKQIREYAESLELKSLLEPSPFTHMTQSEYRKWRTQSQR